DEDLTFADRSNSRCQEAELHRIKGEIDLARGPAYEVEAQSCFLKCLEVARHQSALAWELRGAMSLGKLWCQQGRCEEAKQILSNVYRRFNQGFDTPDLRDARALLDRWSAG